jgi:ABC-type uncharacterized transport system involved in gliding motility auxiliary subunit
VAVDVAEPVAAEATGAADKAGEAPAAPHAAEAKLLVFGDSDFASNRFLDYLGNKDLLVNGVNWLAREDALSGARPQQKAPGKNQFFISQGDADSVFSVSVLWQPGFFLLVGVAILIRRRFGA